MLIPSIDLMDGKIVQLVQGEKKALDFTDFDYWIERFAKYPLVQLIDLDAAIGTGDNHPLIERFLARLPCQVGGGIRTLAAAQQALALGAKRVILGSSLFQGDTIKITFAQELAAALGPGKLTFAVDAKRGLVTTHGWRSLTRFSPEEAMLQLNPYCGAFLYTHVDTEGLLQGFPLGIVPGLQHAAGTCKLMVAGGITTVEEIEKLATLGVDCIVGMAIYTGRIPA